MINQTPLSQAAREGFNRWSGGREKLTGQDLDKLANDPKIQGADQAIIATLRDLPRAVGQRDLTSQAIETFESQGSPALERRFQDNLRRVATPKTLFPQGGPDANVVRQGRQPDCVLTSTCISLAHMRPEELSKLVVEGEKAVVLMLPGENARKVSLPTDRELLQHSCAYQNGAWMTVIAKELGPVGRLNPGQAIKKLTGHKVDRDMMFWTSEQTLKKKLEQALEKRAVVIAGRSGEKESVPGLTKNHSFSVIGYDPAFARVRLQDPEGNEPLDAQGKPRDGDLDGQFSVSVREFKQWFTNVHYEQIAQPSFWGSFFGKLKEAIDVPSGGGGVPVRG